MIAVWRMSQENFMQTYRDRVGDLKLRASYGLNGNQQDVGDYDFMISGNLDHFWKDMLELEENGEIIKTRFGTYGLPEKMGLVVGRFQLTSKGFGFVIPDNKGERPDVFIPPRALGGAMNNDRVMARVWSSLRAYRGPENRNGWTNWCCASVCAISGR